MLTARIKTQLEVWYTQFPSHFFGSLNSGFGPLNYWYKKYSSSATVIGLKALAEEGVMLVLCTPF